MWKYGRNTTGWKGKEGILRNIKAQNKNAPSFSMFDLKTCPETLAIRGCLKFNFGRQYWVFVSGLRWSIFRWREAFDNPLENFVSKYPFHGWLLDFSVQFVSRELSRVFFPKLSAILGSEQIHFTRRKRFTIIKRCATYERMIVSPTVMPLNGQPVYSETGFCGMIFAIRRTEI